MLFAPKKGKKLRSELRKKGGQSGHEALAVLVEAFKDAGSDAVSEAKRLSESEQIGAAINSSKTKIKDYLSQLEQSGYDIAERAQEKFEEISDRTAKASSAFKKRSVVKKKRTVKRAKKTGTKASGTVKKKSLKPAVKKSTSKRTVKSKTRKTPSVSKRTKRVTRKK